MSGDDDSSGWQLTESDPGVFTELLKTLGVDLIVDDLYSLDSEILATLQPIRALIFLFKWVAQSDESGGGAGTYDDDFPGFFAHQTVQNACATLAVLNALLNIPSLKTGPQLEELQSFTAGMDAQTRGLAITSSEFLREAHNSLSPPSVVSLEDLRMPKTKEDAYHYVVYVPVAGSLYELDGLKRSPVRHGEISESEEGWVAKAREAIEARIGTYPPGSLEFNLMAIHEDTIPQLEAQIQAFQSQGNELVAAELTARLMQEKEKRQRWAFENSLRKHNHVGLLHALTLALAKVGKLKDITEQAKTKMRERIEQRRKEGKQMDED